MLVLDCLKDSEFIETDTVNNFLRRKHSPIAVNEDYVNHRSIYIEKLPFKANTEFVKNLFDRFGTFLV